MTLLRWIPWAALVVVLLSGAEGPALAGEAEAKKVAAEGRRLYDQGDYGAAAERYREAFTESQNPRYLLGEAMSRERAGLLQDAIRVFDEYLELAPRGKDSAKVTERVAGLREQLRETHAELRVESDPPGAQVTVDGREVAGVAPFDAWLPYGARLRAALTGYSEADTGGVEVRRDGGARVVLRLVRDGKLRLDCRAEGVSVAVDGQEQGRGPLDIVLDVRAGEHRVRATMGDLVVLDDSVQVAEGTERVVVVALPEQPPLVPPPPPPQPEPGFRVPTSAWIVGGAAVAAAAVGAGLGASALSAGDEANAYASRPGADPARWDELSGTAETHGLASSISFGIAGAAALTAGVLILVDNLSDDGPDPVVMAPVAAADGAGWMVQVRY